MNMRAMMDKNQRKLSSIQDLTTSITIFFSFSSDYLGNENKTNAIF